MPSSHNKPKNMGNGYSNGYSSIPTTTMEHDESPSPRRASWQVVLLSAIGASILGLGGYLAMKAPPTTGDTNAISATTTTTTSTVPWGVNLASWLSLEDYFFVGDTGAIEVATDWGHTAATCFPPLHAHQPWQSETDLLAQLASDGSVKEAILAFCAYRNSFIDLHADLPKIAAHGFKSVRVSVSWCLTDHDPTTDPALDKDDTSLTDEQLWERYACLDPFYAAQGETVRWPAVPKPLLVQFLKACHQYGLTAVLDIHTYAGGTSIGTFSGVWPKWSIFWQYDQPEAPDQDFGRGILRNFFAWVESLQASDPDAFAGLGGITPMNEPGHLAGIFGPGSGNPDKPTFVPDLPLQLRDEYLNDVLQGSIPNGPHLRVLKWQSDAVQAFRETSLPAHMDLVVNVHESILVRALTGDDEHDAGGRHPAATQMIANWWKQVTTTTERAQWAVLDMHHYHAWEPQCQGTVTGHDGSYTCSDVDAAQAVLHKCSTWAQMFRDAVAEPTARLSFGEFSASTHHSVLEACIDSTTLALSYVEQVQAAANANVDLYFWTWKMPHGGAFRPAWSWQELMHQLHPTDPSYAKDESAIPCL